MSSCKPQYSRRGPAPAAPTGRPRPGLPRPEHGVRAPHRWAGPRENRTGWEWGVGCPGRATRGWGRLTEPGQVARRLRMEAGAEWWLVDSHHGGSGQDTGRRSSQDLRLLCAWPRGTRLSWPLLLGPLHAPSWATGLLWSRPRSPRTVCPVSSPVRPAALGDCSDVQFCVPVRLSSVSFTEGLG